MLEKIIPLRQRMLEDLGLRNYAANTRKAYIWHVAKFGKSLEELNYWEVRQYLFAYNPKLSYRCLYASEK